MIRVRQWVADHPARAGALAGWYQQGAGILGAVVVIPFVLDRMGQTDAGVWFSFQSLAAAISLVDFGFSTAISRQVSHSLALKPGAPRLEGTDLIETRPGWDGVEELYSATRVLFSRVMIIAAVLLVLLHFVVVTFTKMLPSHTVQDSAAWYLLGLGTLVMFQTRVQQAFLDGTGKVWLGRTVGGTYQIASTGACVLALVIHPSLLGMAAALLFCALIQYIAIRIALKRMSCERLPACVPYDDDLLSKLWKASVPYGVVTSGGYLATTVQLPVLGSVLGPSAVAPYFLAFRISQALSGLVFPVTIPQLPFFTQECAAGMFTSARKRMERMLGLTVGVNAFIAIAFFTLSPWLVELWVGPGKYVDKSTLLAVSINTAMIGIFSTAGQFVLASGRNPFAIPSLIHGAITVGGVVVLCPALGVVGVPLANLVGGVVTNYWLVPLHALRTWKVLRAVF